jgi:DNA modification methylase
LGDLFELTGENGLTHRLLCGDSTKGEDVDRLMDGEKADLLCADPPYGMGKEIDGVLNDNLTGDDLDSFQMAWWRAFRPGLSDRASAYIWGNAPELWRLWYVSGLKDSEQLSLRSQIIWDKPPSGSPCGSPIGSKDMRSYPHGYETCLFIMVGAERYGSDLSTWFEGFEKFRQMFIGEMTKAGWNMKKVVALTNSSSGHYISKSQYAFPTKWAWETLRDAAKSEAFKQDYEAFKQDYEAVKQDYEAVKEQWYAQRAYFDNTHDKMTDVWDFPRVTGDERHGHATPKPIKLMERIINSSSVTGSVVIEPFLGSGSTMVAAHQLNRRCFGMELSPKYAQTTINRMLKLDPSLQIKKNGQPYEQK